MRINSKRVSDGCDKVKFFKRQIKKEKKKIIIKNIKFHFKNKKSI